MAHSPERKTAVRRAYVVERLALQDAAERHGISYHTARNWKRRAAEEGDDWDKARTAHRMASGGLGDLTAEVLEDFAVLFQGTIEQLRNDDKASPQQKAEALSRLADAYNKTVKAAGASDPKIAKLAVALEVLELLAVFIRDQFPHDIERFVAILDPFGAKVNEVYG